MSDIVLKGEINYNKYVWCASGGSCNACQSLDGMEYEYIDEIPDHPHPNCRCYIEIINNKGDNEDDEPCNCWEYLDELEEALGDATSTQDEGYNGIDELQGAINNIQNIITSNSGELYELAKEIIENAIENVEEYLNELVQRISTFGHFLENYFALLWTNRNEYNEGSSEYYHTRANCQAASNGEIGAATAEVLGETREFFDFYKDVLFKGCSEEKAVQNNIHDLEVNLRGRKIGSEGGRCGDVIFDPESQDK